MDIRKKAAVSTTTPNSTDTKVHNHSDLCKVFNSFFNKPHTFAESYIKLRISGFELCRCVSELRGKGLFGKPHKGVCPITRKDNTEFLIINMFV